MAGEDSRIAAENERIRLQKIADEKAQIKQHGQKMDSAVSGNSGSGGGCLGALLVMASVPLGAFVVERLV